jgi:hypothetical protein
MTCARLRGTIAAIATPLDAAKEPDIERSMRKLPGFGAAFSIDASRVARGQIVPGAAA